MKPFLLLFASVAMAVAVDADMVIQASSIRVVSNSFIICPDQSSTCATGTTCCKLTDGGYGCCRYLEATCCSDNKHCCPNGYQCDDQSERCVKAVGNDTLPWTKKERASSIASEDPAPVNMICPDGGSCAPQSTCCRTFTGSYTCCNFPNNVCCNGGQYCCRIGYICTAGLCIPGLKASPWQALTGARATPSQPAT